MADIIRTLNLTPIFISIDALVCQKFVCVCVCTCAPAFIELFCVVKGKSLALRPQGRVCACAPTCTHACVQIAPGGALRKQEGTRGTCSANENPVPEEEAPDRKRLAVWPSDAVRLSNSHRRFLSPW